MDISSERPHQIDANAPLPAKTQHMYIRKSRMNHTQVTARISVFGVHLTFVNKGKSQKPVAKKPFHGQNQNTFERCIALMSWRVCVNLDRFFLSPLGLNPT